MGGILMVQAVHQQEALVKEVVVMQAHAHGHSSSNTVSSQQHNSGTTSAIVALVLGF